MLKCTIIIESKPITLSPTSHCHLLMTYQDTTQFADYYFHIYAFHYMAGHACSKSQYLAIPKDECSFQGPWPTLQESSPGARYSKTCMIQTQTVVLELMTGSAANIHMYLTHSIMSLLYPFKIWSPLHFHIYTLLRSMKFNFNLINPELSIYHTTCSLWANLYIL